MAKYYGTIGFAQTIEDPPDSGIWKEEIIEKKYYGDVLRHSVHNENGEHLNSNFNVSNDVSIVADSFLLENTHRMRYITFLGAKWEIRTIAIDYPRLTLSIGGVYNGQHGATNVSSESFERTSGSKGRILPAT